MATTRSKNSTKASRKQTAEMEKRLKALHKEGESVKKQLSLLECSIVALPATFQENRLKNWNILPPPEEYRVRQTSAHMPRVHQQTIHRARTQQALCALLLVAAFVGFALWFCQQLQAQHLLD
jgi:uncharacterized protein HemX